MAIHAELVACNAMRLLSCLDVTDVWSACAARSPTRDKPFKAAKQESALVPRGDVASAQVWQNAIAFVDKPPGLCFQEVRRRLKAASGLRVSTVASHHPRLASLT